MQRRPFGATGLAVPVLGFGAMQIGSPRVGDSDAAAILQAALDLGMTLVDTARSYGLSEERVGRHLARRRDEFVLSTKVGYDVCGYPDWTYGAVMAGVDAARDRLRTDFIDIVHLHSCGLDILQAGEVADALARCRDQGKLRVAAYSGDDRALRYAVECGAFGSVQASVNVCDQQALATLAIAQSTRLGTIAKRSLAGRPWAIPAAGADAAHLEYRRRFEALRKHGPDLSMEDWEEAALRFAAYATGVDCVIVGGADLRHLQQNVATVAAGPLGRELEAAIHDVYSQEGSHWRGLI